MRHHAYIKATSYKRGSGTRRTLSLTRHPYTGYRIGCVGCAGAGSGVWVTGAGAGSAGVVA